MKHITEIVPELDTMPEWAEKAFRDGNFFNAALAMYQECEPYLKDGETPAQCIARNRKDMTNSLKQVAQQMKRAEIAEAAIDRARDLAKEWEHQNIDGSSIPSMLSEELLKELNSHHRPQ